MKLNPFSIALGYHISADRIPVENPGKINDSTWAEALEEAIRGIPPVRKGLSPILGDSPALIYFYYGPIANAHSSEADIDTASGCHVSQFGLSGISGVVATAVTYQVY